jgi:hypothetical protein
VRIRLLVLGAGRRSPEGFQTLIHAGNALFSRRNRSFETLQLVELPAQRGAGRFTAGVDPNGSLPER